MGYSFVLPAEKELDEIESKVRDASREAGERRRSIIVNVRGLMTIYVVPWDMVSDVPERWRQGVLVRWLRTASLAERLEREISQKATSQLRSSKTALVAIYDQLSFAELFSEKREIDLPKDSEVEPLLATFPNPMGAVLV